MKTNTNIIDEAEILLGDSSNVIFAATTLGQMINKGLADASQFVPCVVRDGIITTASREIDVSGLVNVIDILHAEYKVDQFPRQLRKVNDLADGIIELCYDYTPTAGLDCYLYCEKSHTLVDPPSTLTGAVNYGAGYAAGSTSIVLDGLGTGTIKAGTLVTFTGIMGQYKVNADATITANAATIVLTSGVRETVANDTVVTFKCSTLTTELEGVLPELAAGYALINWDGSSQAGGSSGRVAVKDAFTLAGESNTLMDTVAAQIALAVTKLNTGSSLVNKVTDGAGFQDYMAWMSGNLQNSAAIIRNAQPFLSEAQVRLGVNQIVQMHRNVGAQMLAMAQQKLRRMTQPRTKGPYSRV